MATVEQRLSHLEGTYQHLATKADLADLKAGLKADVAELKADIARLEAQLVKWMVGIMVGSVAVASSIALLVQRLTE